MTHCNVTQDLLDRERLVVLEELFGYENSEITRIDQGFVAHGYEGTLFSRPILGSSDEILSISLDKISSFTNYYYTFNRMVVAVVGDLENLSFLENLTEMLSDLKHNSTKIAESKEEYVLQSGKLKIPSTLDMNYFIYGFPAPCRNDPSRINIYALSNYLGDGIHSILFNKLRQEKGLAYSIKTEYHLYQATGYFSARF